MNNWSKYEKHDQIGMKLDDFLKTLPRTKIIYIPVYEDWFDIIKQDGNRVLIDFYGKSFVYNFLGVEGVEIV
jgi:hypothetical protein